MRAFIVLVLALVGCGPGPGLGLVQVVSPDPAAAGLAAYGARTWAAAGVPVVLGPGPVGLPVAVHIVADIKAACGIAHIDRSIDGCVRDLGSAVPRVFVRSGLAPARARSVIVHELGHAIRGEAGHLDCRGAVPGEHAMCPAGGPAQPTDRDIRFVTGECDDDC